MYFLNFLKLSELTGVIFCDLIDIRLSGQWRATSAAGYSIGCHRPINQRWRTDSICESIVEGRWRGEKGETNGTAASNFKFNLPPEGQISEFLFKSGITEG